MHYSSSKYVNLWISYSWWESRIQEESWYFGRHYAKYWNLIWNNFHSFLFPSLNSFTLYNVQIMLLSCEGSQWNSSFCNCYADSWLYLVVNDLLINNSVARYLFICWLSSIGFCLNHHHYVSIGTVLKDVRTFRFVNHMGIVLYCQCFQKLPCSISIFYVSLWFLDSKTSNIFKLKFNVWHLSDCQQWVVLVSDF